MTMSEKSRWKSTITWDVEAHGWKTYHSYAEMWNLPKCSFGTSPGGVMDAGCMCFKSEKDMRQGWGKEQQKSLGTRYKWLALAFKWTQPGTSPAKVVFLRKHQGGDMSGVRHSPKSFTHAIFQQERLIRQRMPVEIHTQHRRKFPKIIQFFERKTLLLTGWNAVCKSLCLKRTPHLQDTISCLCQMDCVSVNDLFNRRLIYFPGVLIESTVADP